MTDDGIGEHRAGCDVTSDRSDRCDGERRCTQLSCVLLWHHLLAPGGEILKSSITTNPSKSIANMSMFIAFHCACTRIYKPIEPIKPQDLSKEGEKLQKTIAVMIASHLGLLPLFNFCPQSHETFFFQSQCAFECVDFSVSLLITQPSFNPEAISGSGQITVGHRRVKVFSDNWITTPSS